MSSKTVQPSSTKKPLTFKQRLWRRTLYFLRLFGFLCVVLYLTVSVVATEFSLSSPDRTSSKTTPADYGLKFDEVSFPASEDKLTIRGWFVPMQSDKAIIAIHGKGTSRAAMLHRSLFLADNGYNLLMLDMRGHGSSDGDRFSFGYYEQRDILGAVEYLKKRGFKPEHIGVMSHSMGAATGLLAMARTPDIKAIVADAAYANLGKELEFGANVTSGGWLSPFLPGMLVEARLVHGIDVNEVRPEEAIKHLNGRHVFLIQGDHDPLVPSDNIYILKAAAGNSAEMWVVPGADHVNADSVATEEYFRRVLAFFKREL